MRVSLILPSLANGRVAAAGGNTFAHEVIIANGCDWLAGALDKATGDVALIVPPFFALAGDALDRVAVAFERDDVQIAYADWSVGDVEARTLRVFVDASDFSEASDVGFLRAYRLDAVRAVGGVDRSFGVAAEYDLKLKLLERGVPARIEGALANQLASLAEIERDAPEWFDLNPFMLERHRHSGFGYLFYPQVAQDAARRAFFASLSRRGAFLSGPTRRIACPHTAERSPKVSVVIRSYNRARYIGRAIESVLNGDFEDFELIVVDGGSTDGTCELMSFYAKDARVRLIVNPANIPAQSFNIGLAAARGKYVSELDSDDEYVPETLKNQIAFLEAHPDCALAISYYRVIGSDGEPWGKMPEVRHGEFDRNNLLRTSGAGAVRTWHRCILEELGGFDAERFPWYSEDYDLLLRASEHYQVGRVHQALYRYRLHGANSEQVLSLESRYQQKNVARRRALERRISSNRHHVLTRHVAARPREMCE